jgi:hypothetical protein
MAHRPASTLVRGAENVTTVLHLASVNTEHALLLIQPAILEKLGNILCQQNEEKVSSMAS